MTAHLIDGKQIAAEIRADVKRKVEERAQRASTPGLATVLVDNPLASIRAQQTEMCAEVGIRSFGHTLPADASQSEVEAWCAS